MLTARAATSPIVISESISILTRTVSGIVSVGLNAVALVNDVYR